MRKLKNTPDKLGYVEKGLTHNKQKFTTFLHIFTWECYNKKLAPKGYHIHHIDDKIINGFKINNIENLECLTASEHMKLTRKENPKGSIKGGITRGVSGKAINPDTNEEKIFTSNVGKRSFRMSSVKMSSQRIVSYFIHYYGFSF